MNLSLFCSRPLRGRAFDPGVTNPGYSRKNRRNRPTDHQTLPGRGQLSNGLIDQRSQEIIISGDETLRIPPRIPGIGREGRDQAIAGTRHGDPRRRRSLRRGRHVHDEAGSVRRP